MSSPAAEDMFDGFIPLLVEILPDLILPHEEIALGEIYGIVKEYLPEQCDDTVLCRCGERDSGQPEWKHRVRSALRTLDRNEVMCRVAPETYMLVDANAPKPFLFLGCEGCATMYEYSPDPLIRFCIACGAPLVIRHGPFPPTELKPISIN